MKFETVQIYFLSEILVLLPWQHDVTTSLVSFACIILQFHEGLASLDDSL